MRTGTDCTIYYGCDADGYANFFASVDLETKERIIINDYELEVSFIASDLTYDYSTNTLYAIVSTDDGETSALAVVNPATGGIETVAALDDVYVALAANYDGTLYAVSLAGDLYTIGKTDGTTVLVLETGISSDYPCSQSMDFDHTDGALYWNSYVYHDDGEFYESALIKIDVRQHTFENLGTVGDNAQICGLYVPFVRNSLDAPVAATEVTLVPGDGGANSALLSWKNPETTLNEDRLTELAQVTVIRNGTPLKTYDRPQPGAMLTFEDMQVVTGSYTYTIVASNAAGDGLPATISGFIGRDVPAAVTHLTLSKEGERTARLVWEAPSAGLHGGWIDLASLSYRITRYPDGREVAAGWHECEFTDPGLTSLNNYSYTVETFTADGKGGIAESEKVLIGKALSLPYQATLNKEEAGQWTVVDANGDGKSWEFESLLAKFFFGDEQPGAYCFGAEGGTDEWLVTSPVALEGSKSYKVAFDAQVSTKGEVAMLEVTLGKGTDLAAHKVITTFKITNNFNPEEKVVSMVGPQDGDYCIGLHLKTTDHSKLRIVGFGVDRCAASYLSGVVTAGQQPLDKVLVQVKNLDGQVVSDTRTGVEGGYTFPYIEQGTYLLTATLPGYAPIEQELIAGEPEIRTINLELVKADEFALRGSVKNEADMPLAAVSIAVKGDLNYQVMTGQDGTFEIPRAAAGTYTLLAYKNGYEQYVTEIELAADETRDAIVLKHKVLPPSRLTVDSGNSTLTLDWKEPVEYKTFRYDNGRQVMDFGINGGTYYGVAGSVYRQPARLTAATWYTIDDGYDDHDFVNLFIFDLDEGGEPTNRLLFQIDGIKNNNGSWTTYAFEEPVDCPHGFVVALGVDGGYLALGATDADEEYPFVPQTQCSSRDYEREAFYYLEELDYKNTFMIRAEGIPTGAPIAHLPGTASPEKKQAIAPAGEKIVFSRQAKRQTAGNVRETALPTAVYPSYQVYRVKAGETSQTEKWTLLTPQPIAAFTFTDAAWNTLPQGYYQYAVRAVYTGNRLSEATLSDTVGKDVLTRVVVQVTTNVEGASTEGASVRLESGEDIYTVGTDASGNATFGNVRKGIYRLTVRLKGCEEYSEEADYSTDAQYTARVCLTESLAAPHALTVRRNDDGTSYLFSWNEFTITDDFEAHPDFAVNSPGEAGWSYIDADGSVTKGFKDGATGEWYEFENMFAPMAFIVFNPSAVQPSMESEFQAHSGRKFLACLGGEGANDDYLISRELDGTDSFTFRFFALSYDGKDQMEAGYSFNGKEAEEFVWNTGVIPLTTAKEWKEYSFAIPAGVRRVAVRCISPSPVIFMIDDVYITTGPDSRAAAEGLGAHEYEIYLDGKNVATQRNIAYNFAGISGGKHVAGVKAVYRSGASELATVEFDASGSGVSGEANEAVLLYPNPVREELHVRGEAERIEIYNSNGILSGSYDHPVNIAVGHLESGMYTARIITRNDLTVQKIVIGE